MAQNEIVQLDFDALQAQIDLSMSTTDQLVSSWIQPSVTKSTKVGSSHKTTEKEIQEYLRRPPRLGVGAPIPESSGVAERENEKLRNKLSINDKKRKRGEPVERVDQGQDEEEKAERKGEAGSKKVRIDPFSMPKKKKATNVAEGQAKDARVKVSEGAEDAEASTKVARKDEAESERRPSQAADDLSKSPILLKKKKRKKKSKGAEAFADGQTDSAKANEEPEEYATNADASGVLEAADGEEEEEWTGFGDSVHMESLICQNSEGAESLTNHSNPPDEPSTPTTNIPPSTALQISPTRPIPSLLNLTGPPPSDTGEDASQSGLSPSAKRRRRRKNKKKLQIEGGNRHY